MTLKVIIMALFNQFNLFVKQEKVIFMHFHELKIFHALNKNFHAQYTTSYFIMFLNKIY